MRDERLHTRRSKGSILRKNNSSLNKEVNQFRKKQNILWGCTKLTAHTAKGVQCSDTQDVRNELKGQESVTKKAKEYVQKEEHQRAVDWRKKGLKVMR